MSDAPTAPTSADAAKSGSEQPGAIFAELLISRVIIRSFRYLENVEVSLEPDMTVLIGENNAGKTTFLLALATALGRRRPVRDDLHRGKDGSIAGSAVVDLFVTPPNGQNRFSDVMRQRLLAVQREPGTNRETLAFRTVITPSGEGSFLSTERRFLQPDLPGTNWIEAGTAFHSRVLELFDSHLLEAARDLVAETSVLSSSWGRVLSDLQIPDRPDGADSTPDPLGRRGLEQDLKTISDRVRSASPVLSMLQKDLAGIANAQATVNNVELMPLPLRIDELGRTMEVIFFQHGSADLPLRFHGMGSRSLAALLVFRTMCSLRVGADQGVRPWLVTLLEEPEAHLHPHAVAALPLVLNGIPGQRVVASHSSTLVAEVPLRCLRLLRRTDSGIAVRSISTLEPRQAEKFRRFFGRPFGDVFFARLVVFGDGPTERNALPVLVGWGLQRDPAGQGITFVGSSLGNHEIINPVLRTLHDLGIPWICFADNDDAGKSALSKLRDPATGAPLAQDHPAVVVVIGTKQLEQLLIDAGYAQEITDVAADSGTSAMTDPERLDFLVRCKPWAAELVVLRAKEAGKTFPTHLSGLISAIKSRLPTTSAGAKAEGVN